VDEKEHEYALKKNYGGKMYLVLQLLAHLEMGIVIPTAEMPGTPHFVLLSLARGIVRLPVDQVNQGFFSGNIARNTW